MLCDIITDVVAHQSDMEVLGMLPDRATLVMTALATRAEVVVLGLPDGELPDECAKVFDADPHIRVLGVVADGRRAFLYELRPQRLALGEISPHGLVEAIRATRVRGVLGAQP